MTTIITNKNFLPTIGFKFGIKKLPATNYFAQSVNLPGVKLGSVGIANPFIKYPIPGDQIEYDDLTVTFKVDENMKNYLELYDWILGLGFPDTFEQYRLLNDKNPALGEGKISDGVIQVLSSSRNTNININIIDMFPRSLSNIIFDSRDSNLEYAQATAVFKFRKIQIEQL